MEGLDWEAMPMIRSGSSCSFDPIDMISCWKIAQRHEAATKLVADSVTAKSSTNPNWDCYKMGSLFSPAQDNMSKLCNNPLAVCDFSSNGVISNTNTGPLESLDYLFTVTRASNTDDTLVEYDGISRILSGDSKNLWNFFNTDNAAASSEESAINDRNNIQCPVDNSDEIPVRYLEANRYMNKRSHDHTMLEPDFSTEDFGFQLISENQPKFKKLKPENQHSSSSNINFQQASSSASSINDPDSDAIVQMQQLIYRAAAFKSVNVSVEEVEKPKRKNIRISTDPQTVAARRRRERISEKIRILQRMIPGGNKMDTASMLDEAAKYLKFLRTQVKELEAFGHKINPIFTYNFSSLSSLPFNYPFPMQHNLLLGKPSRT